MDVENLVRRPNLCNHAIMISDDMQSKNARGRPATGISPSVGVRIPPTELALIDRWRAAQPGIPSRPEAIRQLVAIGLKAAEVGDSQ
jgi:hypothetical protein